MFSFKMNKSTPQPQTAAALRNISMQNIQQNKSYEVSNRQISAAIALNSSSNNDSDKMPWGNPTWTLLHTMAANVSEANFFENRLEILNIIFAICTNLPCPVCSDHAKSNLNKIGFLRIRTKSDLIEILFNFHNEVNLSKGYTAFSRALISKYASTNFRHILANFINAFNKSSGGGRYLAAEMFRSRLTVRLQNWFNKNVSMFE